MSICCVTVRPACSPSLSLCLLRPGACLVVSGPGLIHALGGMANANMNCWWDHTHLHFKTGPPVAPWVNECMVPSAQAGGCYWRLLGSQPGDGRRLPGVSSGKQHLGFGSFPCWCFIELTQLSTCPQVEACRLYSKFSARPSSLEAIPSVVEKVVFCLVVLCPWRSSLNGMFCCITVTEIANFLFILSAGCSHKHLWPSGCLLCWHCRGHGEC